MSFEQTKVIRCFFGEVEYHVFLDATERVTMVITYARRASVGTTIPWSATPWQVKEFVERELDPHLQ